jgi:pimeloyl-ACP methyl ester carboxylesterase
MGGKVALTLALTRPELVERLILVDIAPIAYPQGYSGFIRAMLALDLAAVTKRADADAALAPAVPDPAMRGFLLQNLGPTAAGGFAWQPNLAVLLEAMPTLTDFPRTSPRHSWDGPAFCLRGERSDYVGPDGEAALRRLLPRVEVSTVAGAGHWPHAERPAEFLRLLEPCLGG